MLTIKYLTAALILVAANINASELSAPFNEQVASVNQHVISAAQLHEQSREQIRQRFYHGKPPLEEQNTFMLEITNKLIDQHLLAQEAQRLGLSAQQKEVDEAIEQYDTRYRQHPNWADAKQYFIPMYNKQLQEQSLVKQLKEKIHQQAAQNKQQVTSFYRQHPEKFTQPPQVRASLILIGVEPSARGFVWQIAIDQANNIIDKIEAGEDFATLAELHSTDPSADQQGDMGFLHQGMTAKRAEEAMKDLTIGEHTPHIMLLDGVAIFKVTDRKPAMLHDFSEVEQRATSLANIHAKTQIWQQLIDKLRATAAITIDHSKLVIK